MRRAWAAGVRAIERDRESGASVLAEQALTLLARGWLDGGDTREVAALARKLRGARPSMPVLANVVNRAMTAALDSPPDKRGKATLMTLATVTAARWAASRQAADLARGSVLTLSASETVTKALRASARARRVTRVVVGEGRPGFEGRETAAALAKEGVAVELIVDAALGLFAAGADVALVGADAVLADGAIVNKVGTNLLALACREAGVPFYAVADSFKVSPATAIPLEEKAPREVLARAPPGVTPRNIYFDRTPAELVTGIVTEGGVLKPMDVAPLAGAAKRDARWSEERST
ncbi:MAG: translation initiation factor eIF-2B [Thermoplasmatota archaeon]